MMRYFCSLIMSLMLLAVSHAMDLEKVSYEPRIGHTDSRDAIIAHYHNRDIGRILYKSNRIYWLRVDKEHQSRGIGSELFIRCLAEIAKQHTRAVWCAENSLSFYDRFGARVYDSHESNQPEMEFVFSRDGDPRTNLILRKNNP